MTPAASDRAGRMPEAEMSRQGRTTVLPEDSLAREEGRERTEAERGDRGQSEREVFVP